MAADRNAELAKIHIAKAQLDLDEKTYRDILWKVGRVTSSADLDAAGRQKLMRHFATLGWRPRAPKRKPDPDRPHNLNTSKQLQRIDWLLRRAGRPWAYVQPGMVRRIAGKDRIEFCTPAELSKLIAALEIDGRRKRA